MTEERKRMSVQEVAAAAMELSREERLSLLEQVEDSLYSDEIDPEILERAQRTLDAIRAGRATTVPADEVLDMLDRMAS